MDRLQLIIAVSDVILGRYGNGDAREKGLERAGYRKADRKIIQNEVTAVIGRSLETQYLAVACISGRYGNDEERKKALGHRYEKVRLRINAIYDMRGKTTTAAAKDVINGNYDKEPVRSLLLRFCGYNPSTVQAEVDRLLKKPSGASETKFRIHVEHFCRKDESAYGACTAIYQYAADGKTIEKCVLIDTAMGKTAPVVIADLKAQGVKQIDALIISHAHGDHYGGLSEIAKAIHVKWLYLPDPAELDKYQKSYGNALRRQAKKVANVRWYRQGDSAVFGEIRFQCLYACRAADLKEHDPHHFVNNMSPFNYFTCGSFIWHTAGDAQNPANNLFVDAMKKAGTSTKCHGLEFHWHTDGNATNDALMQATRPKICGSNYHHPKWISGRKGPKKKAEAVGAHCYSTADDGSVYIDISGRKAVVSTSKSGKYDTYTIT